MKSAVAPFWRTNSFSASSLARGASLCTLPFLVSKLAIQICCEPSYEAVNDRYLPSGDQRGRSSPCGVAISKRSFADPSAGTIHMCGVFVFAARSTSTALKTTHLPSGEGTGSFTRFSFIMSSKVKGRFAASPCAPAKLDSNNKQPSQRLIENASAKLPSLAGTAVSKVGVSTFPHVALAVHL